MVKKPVAAGPLDWSLVRTPTTAKMRLFFVLLMALAVNGYAQQTYVLSALDTGYVRFCYDTTYEVTIELGKKVIMSPTELKKHESELNNNNDSFMTFPLYNSVSLLKIDNLPMRPGRYVVFADQNFQESWVVLIFDIDDDKIKKIISSEKFYKYTIKDASRIVFTNP